LQARGEQRGGINAVGGRAGSPKAGTSGINKHGRGSRRAEAQPGRA